MPEKYFEIKNIAHYKLPLKPDEQLEGLVKSRCMIFGCEVFEGEGKGQEFKNYKVKITQEEEKALKHRYYARYDLNSNNAYKGSLVFIMFNPSTASPDKLDDTIKNCLILAKKEGYKQVEILNLYSYRNSEVSKICTEDNEINKSFVEDFIDNNKEADYVLAWGYGKENNNVFKKCVNELKSKIYEKENGQRKIKNIYTIGVDLIKINNYNHHPCRTAWSGMGKFEDIAILIENKEDEKNEG